MFQQSNSLGTLRKILHTYGLPNRWEVGGEMTLGNDAQVVGRVAALAGSPHADFLRGALGTGDRVMSGIIACRTHLSYDDYWSMVGDIVIIAKTLRAVFQRDGAY